ncbi:MAG: integrase arm-type DNA-binding domain-containing protein [Asticcacaulis sp.]|uniref:tyrosine-type recombinase/integrase n=1 Tax=Asticcacaulis sp. TaxID=1872648 RepID=UPI0025BD53F9|nr:site-specific integrase [Asticcacaulis sp.]MCA1934771.1 integrase arm-type DNA-binding domain-containing protein [Asticcacaulis sp.]
MPRRVSRALTVAEVKAKPPGRYADGGGLYLLVKSSGARSWVFRFMLNGKGRDIGLGTAVGDGSISLANARRKADDLLRMVRDGIDPLAERSERQAAAKARDSALVASQMTFRSAALAYIALNEGSWRNPKHRQQWSNTLSTYVFPVIGDLPVAEVDTPHVLRIIEPLWLAKPETASRVRGRIETILDSAKARGFRTGENPARWRGHIAQILPPRKRLSRGHHKALPSDEIPALMVALRKRDALAARALEFTILTAARTGEVLGADWSEIDFDNAVWTVPKERMKAGVEHRVPLSDRAAEILRTVACLGERKVFPGERGDALSGMAMTRLLKRMEIDVTVHGFRSSFRDWAAERTNYAHEVCEMALAHTIGNKAEAAYRRGSLFEKRRRLMDEWAVYCANVVSGKQSDLQIIAGPGSDINSAT